MKSVITMLLCTTAILASEGEELSEVIPSQHHSSMLNLKCSSEIVIDEGRRKTLNPSQTSPALQRRMDSTPLLYNTNFDKTRIISVTKVSNRISGYVAGAFYLHPTDSGYKIMWNNKGVKKQLKLFRKYEGVGNKTKQTPKSFLKEEALWFAKKYRLPEERYLVSKNAMKEQKSNSEYEIVKKRMIKSGTFINKSFLQDRYKNEIDSLISYKANFYLALNRFSSVKDLRRVNYQIIKDLDEASAKLNKCIKQISNRWGGQELRPPREFKDIAEDLINFQTVSIKKVRPRVAKKTLRLGKTDNEQTSMILPSRKQGITSKISETIKIGGATLEILASGNQKLTIDLDQVEVYVNELDKSYKFIPCDLTLKQLQDKLGAKDDVRQRVQKLWNKQYRNSNAKVQGESLKQELVTLSAFEFKIYYYLNQLLQQGSKFSQDKNSQSNLMKYIRQFEHKANYLVKIYG